MTKTDSRPCQEISPQIPDFALASTEVADITGPAVDAKPEPARLDANHLQDTTAADRAFVRAKAEPQVHRAGELESMNLYLR